MATTTTKAKVDKQNLSRSKSFNPQGERRPKSEANTQPSSSTDPNDQKPNKPIPNYLKPTISSQPDSAKFLNKNFNNALEDSQKFLRRRSFDKPPTALPSRPSSVSSSSSSPRIQKSLDISPVRSRVDRPLVPREKAVTTTRSSSFHAGRSSSGAWKPKATGKSQVGSRATNVAKKSSLSTASNGKKETTAIASSKKDPDVNADEMVSETMSIETMSMEGNLQESPLAVHEVEVEIVKVATEIQVADESLHSEDKQVRVEAVQPETEEDDKEINQSDIYQVSESPDVMAKTEEEAKDNCKSGDEKMEEQIGEKIEEKMEEQVEEKTENEIKETIEEQVGEKIEDKIESLVEEAKEVDKQQEYNDEKAEGEIEAKTEVEDDKEEENLNTVASDQNAATIIEETVENDKESDNGTVENEKESDHEKEKDTNSVEEGSSEAMDKPKATETVEVAKRQVVQGNKKESPAAYNDVIEETRRKLLEERKNKVKALVGAFETVIDYESASSR